MPSVAKWRCDVDSDHEEFEIEGRIYRREDLLRLRADGALPFTKLSRRQVAVRCPAVDLSTGFPGAKCLVLDPRASRRITTACDPVIEPTSPSETAQPYCFSVT